MNSFFSFLGQFEKKNYVILIILGLINSIIEILGLSLMFPLFEILLGNNDSKILSIFKDINFLKNYNTENIFLFILLLIASIYILKFLISLLIVFYNNLIKQNIKIEVQKKILNNFFIRDYIRHGEDNIPTQIRIVTSESESALIVVETFFMFLIEIFILVFIGFFLLINFFKISVIMLSVFITIFIIYFFFFDKKLKILGEKRILEQNLIFKNIYSSLSIFREIKFLNKEKFFLNKIFKNFYKLRRITLINVFINNITRHLLELFVVFIVVISLYYSKFVLGYDNNEILSSLGIILAAIIRAFPSITKIFFYHQKISFNDRSTKIISNIFNEKNEILKKENLNNKDFYLFEEISIENLNYSYPGREGIINNINLKIKFNDCLGIKGRNGSGKSTLLDLITGVIKPDDGFIKIDDVDIFENINNWQNRIVFLSQKNYLFEDTIISNIVLGEKEENIDQKKLKYALNISNLNNFIENLNLKEKTVIGSNNISLSGGQQKKVQIARIFYQLDKNKKLLIFDEPFENLDDETRQIFINEINNLRSNYCIIIISHQENDLQICNKIFEIEKKFLISKKHNF